MLEDRTAFQMDFYRLEKLVDSNHVKLKANEKSGAGKE